MGIPQSMTTINNPNGPNKIEELLESLTPEDLLKAGNLFISHNKLVTSQNAHAQYKSEHPNEEALHDQFGTVAKQRKMRVAT